MQKKDAEATKIKCHFSPKLVSAMGSVGTQEILRMMASEALEASLVWAD